MPRIKTITRKLSGEKFDFQLNYSTKIGKFYFGNVPEHVTKLVGSPDKMATETEAVAQLDEFLIQYHEATKSIKKVILWKFHVLEGTYSERIFKKTWNSDNLEIALKNNRQFKEKFAWSRSDGHGFELQFESVFLQTGQENKFHYITYDKDRNETPGYSTDRYRGWEMMDHTPEREAFFHALAGGTRTMAKRIADFLGQENENLLALLDAAGPLALPVG